MPELPEVETVRRGVQLCLPGRRLDDVAFRRADLRWPIPTRRVRGLCGSRCTTIERRSKYLLLRFGDATAIVHLGMSGRLFIDKLRRGAEPPEWQLHEHWRMRFGNRLLRYADARRFGMLDVAAGDELATHWLLAGLGPEPLGEAFTAEYLYGRTRGRKVATKTFIMDQKHVVGVGNIYASEACFRAGVRPGRRAARLSQAECGRLVDAIRDVLGDAIAAGGTTLRDYIGVDQDSGYFQRELRVYGRDGEACLGCETPIKRTVQGQRSTYYCPHCQS